MILDQLGSLFSALERFYDEQAAQAGPAMLAQVAGELGRVTAGDITVPEPAPLPATQLLERLDPGADPVLGEFLGLAGALTWTQTAAYAETLSSHFLDNYGYVRLVGPTAAALVSSTRVAVGVGVWGSGLYYPRHAHPSEEAYHVLAGDVGFSGADGVRRELHPGDCAHNGPDEPHELWVGPPGEDPDRSPPCVLLWAWVGEIGVDARLV